ncbi:3-keto-disaccharide hydrolase [Marivirga lumbricoides]
MNMRKSFWAFTAAALVAFACDSTKKESNENTEAVDSTAVSEVTEEESTAPNSLSAAEQEEGWKLLFDGTSTDGWRGYMSEEFPSDWKVEDGTLYMSASGRGEAGSENGGDILYDEKYGNFHLKVDWKISEGGNSGIFYLGQESDKYDYIWKTAPEMQVLDNEKHPDAMLGTDGNRKAGSLYDLYPAKPASAVNPVGEWNTAEVISYNGTVVHKLNGETVVEYHLWTPQWKEDVAKSKFPELNENWAEVAKEGYIGLQDHGDDVWFRNIKIKQL